jgi:hypothetical protein
MVLLRLREIFINVIIRQYKKNGAGCFSLQVLHIAVTGTASSSQLVFECAHPEVSLSLIRLSQVALVRNSICEIGGLWFKLRSGVRNLHGSRGGRQG